MEALLEAGGCSTWLKNREMRIMYYNCIKYIKEISKDKGKMKNITDRLKRT